MEYITNDFRQKIIKHFRASIELLHPPTFPPTIRHDNSIATFVSISIPICEVRATCISFSPMNEQVPPLYILFPLLIKLSFATYIFRNPQSKQQDMILILHQIFLGILFIPNEAKTIHQSLTNGKRSLVNLISSTSSPRNEKTSTNANTPGMPGQE